MISLWQHEDNYILRKLRYLSLVLEKAKMSFQPMEIRTVSLETIKSISTLLSRSLRTAKLTVPTKDRTMCLSLVLYILKVRQKRIKENRMHLDCTSVVFLAEGKRSRVNIPPSQIARLWKSNHTCITMFFYFHLVRLITLLIKSTNNFINTITEYNPYLKQILPF